MVKAGMCSKEKDTSDVDLALDLAGVFCKIRAVQLPPHRLYDLVIDLVPGFTPPWGRLYSLSTMEDYVTEAHSNSTIRPSSSPAMAGFFFIKKDGSLRPCIDYQGLNCITVKNRHPLPLINMALDALSGT